MDPQPIKKLEFFIYEQPGTSGGFPDCLVHNFMRVLRVTQLEGTDM